MSVHFSLLNTGARSLKPERHHLMSMGLHYLATHTLFAAITAVSIPIPYYSSADNMLLRPVTSLYNRILTFILPEVYILVY